MRVTETNTAVREETARVFFAIWPDAAAQRRLAELAERLETVCEGRKVRAENIHLTLVFLGEVSVDRLDALCQAASEVQGAGARAFDFAVEEICYWKHNRIAYAGTAKVPQGLLDLVSALQSALSAAGFSFDRQAYVPHITLVRKAKCPAPSIEFRTGLLELAQSVVWPVREWILVKSGQANGRSGYTPIGRWPLA
ncbi:MAG: RNA 2',3'-cyclic phosphodiesterase [Nitrosomonadaceae bacterium]|nr:RNA 2',3'-cyclic phosphodiesterase [Nitrosomonadaceae bacterium]